MKLLLLTLITFTNLSLFAETITIPDSCKTSCNQNCNKIAKKLSRKSNELKEVCGNRPDNPRGSSSILLYSSDSCNGAVIAAIGPSTNCDSLGTGSVWGVKINGVCENNTDTTLTKACEKFKGGEINIYSTDSCSSGLLASVGPKTQCDKLGTGSAWGVKINGVCENNTDTTLVKACERFKSKRVQIYSTDSCNSGLLASVGPKTQCDKLGTGNAWGVKINGVCENSTDTTLVKACEKFKSGKVNIYSTDSCSSGLLASVGPKTECNKLETGNAWGIKINGVCENISDTTLVKACEKFRGR